MKVEATSST